MVVPVFLAALLAASPSARAETDEPPPLPVDESLLSVLQLPMLAQSLRAADVPEEEVKEAIESAKAHGLDAPGTADLLRRSSQAVRDHGHIENFGGFVQEQLDAGKRGQDLAAAIREVHAERGRIRVLERERAEKKARAEGRGDDGLDEPGQSHGPPDGKGPGEGHGPPDGKGPGEGAHDGSGPKGPPAGSGGAEGSGPKGPPDHAGQGGKHGQEGR